MAASAPQTIGQLVDAMDQAEPLDRRTLESLLGRQLPCSLGSRIDCEAHDIVLGEEVVGDLDFRSTRLGSILALTGFGKTCVSTKTLMDRFGPGALEQSCTDGVICMYWSAKRSWGRLSVGLPDDLKSDCAKSVILNSIPQ